MVEQHLDAITAAAVALTATLGALDAPSEQHIASLSVDPTYAGVFRVGLGMGWSAVEDASYVASTALAGDHQGSLVIQESARGPYHLDLVTGYSHYFSRRAETNSSPSVAATVGLSAASVSDDGKVELLDMAYTGLEMGWRELGAALCFSLRRGETLRQGLAVDQVVDAPADRQNLVTTHFVPGVTLVLYPPTGFLKTGKTGP